jgi:hypothetical protein
MKEKIAQCIRKVANISTSKPQYKFDSSSFSKDALSQDLPVISPKLTKLLDTIQELDQSDLKTHGHMFKHFIFSDIKPTSHGVKAIVSAMLASGYTLAYDEKLQLIQNPDENGKITALLCSSALYGDKKITSALKIELLSIFNERPTNVHGHRIRFIVMDSGFKEGIDLFDVKYVHLLEPQVTNADTKQVIGRSTRVCGQKGLLFHPRKGWPLQVFVYDSVLTKGNHLPLKWSDPNLVSLHDIFTTLSNQDQRRVNLQETLEKMVAQMAVDYPLTGAFHAGGGNTQVGGNGSGIECGSSRCGKVRKTKAVPASTALLAIAWLAMGREIPRDLEDAKHPRPFFCQQLKTDADFCNTAADANANTPHFLIAHGLTLRSAIQRHLHKPLSKSLRATILKLLRSVKRENQSQLTPPPPPKPATLQEMHAYIVKYYKQHVWPPIKMENTCGGPVKDTQTQSGGGKATVLSPTQGFVRTYFTPESPYKGILLNHTVGVGKTCAAIATATTTFEPAGYTILWVTRSTLKNEVWKNMFDVVCHDKLVGKASKLPQANKDRMKLLSDAWSIRPMSYRQFSNLVEGKNKLYKALVERNGKEDPLRKTLVIIDEAHKLYGATDLAAQERPDMEKFAGALKHSYTVSGNDSARVMLMTATPITQDPMELIKLLNLLHDDPREEMADDFNQFAKNYLNEIGQFTEAGRQQFETLAVGYISYLDRSKDARQFAQPIITNVDVAISRADPRVNELATEQKELKAHLKQLKEEAKEEMRDLLANGKACRRMHVAKDRAVCLEQLRTEKEDRRDIRNENQRQTLALLKQNREAILASKPVSDQSQEYALKERCMSKK